MKRIVLVGGLLLVIAACSSGDSSSLNPDSGTCVDTINQYRATLGLAPYARWKDEETCAGGEAQTDSSHAGSPHWSFVNESQPCNERAQDECPGWLGPASSMITGCLKQMWAEGPGGGHYDNMSSTAYTKVACGFYTMPDGSVWAVQNFH